MLHKSNFFLTLLLAILMAGLLAGCGPAAPSQSVGEVPATSQVATATIPSQPPTARTTPTSLTATTRPTNTLRPTDTPVPSPTLTATPAAPVVETRRWADVYAGPGTDYRKLASFAGGVPFDASGRNSEASWVQIGLSPVLVGWIPVSDLLEPSDLVTSLPEIVVAPPPAPTRTAQGVSKIFISYRLEDGAGLFVTIDGLAKTQYYIIQILTDKGQVKVKRDFNTAQRSKMLEVFEVAAWPNGNYTIQVLFSGQVVAQKGFTIERKK